MVTRRLRSTLATCTALAVFSLACGAAAQQAAQPQTDTTLKPIVLKGKRVKAGSLAADTPLASQTTAEDIRKRDIVNLQDLGRTTEAGVDYVDTKPGKPGGLFLRGLGGARVVTLVDGIPIQYFENFAREGQATTSLSSTNSTFDFSSLATVNVVRGADSSRIGSGALGGALVLRTLEPEDLIGPDKDWGGVVKADTSSEDRSVGGSLAVAKKIENTSILFQGAYKRGLERDNRGVRDIDGSARTVPNPSETDQSNLMFKIRHDIEGGHRIGITAERFLSKSDTDLRTLWGGTAATSYLTGEYSGDERRERDRVSLDYEYEAPEAGSPISRANLSLYWQRLAQESGSGSLRNNGTTYIRHDSMQNNAYGIIGGLESDFSTGGIDHTVRFGGAASLQYFNEYLYANTAGSTAASESDMPDVTGKSLGLYLEDQMSFGNSSFTLTPGIRFDAYDFDPDPLLSGNAGYSSPIGYPSGTNGSQFSPKLLATYDLTPEVQLFAQWSMAYRAPTMNELYLMFSNIATAGYIVVGNPTLKAETSNGFEIGATYQDADLTGKLTLFHNRYKNFIDQVVESTTLWASPAPPFGPGTINTYRNRGNVEISGVEAKVRKEFANGFYTHGSLAYAFGRDTRTNEYIRTIAPFKAIVGVGYNQETWGTELTGIFSTGMRPDGQTNTFEAPGYGIANLTGWWEPEQTKGLRIQAGVYNIFDTRYYNAVGVRGVNPTTASSTNQPVAFYSEPGRSFKLSLTQRF
ncbi:MULTISPECIES: TonB-dependent hemoglobin/transferrin/lactoferrin family receptor [unclassified Neorhizobium]|uniref:TonB-dependent hemoglobin/transferrin/lactoferrin family receptor n=1 Tax=unclassified Neorhizobium TaxID=2629175 RepID=UPI001FF4BB26|nr:MULTISPECIES: TonB-dependent hemoglobin/transferrin/lactoferrin family receptor [unclassified Neorhizobium]MCJ9673111.1 TonB-dependent hemoglobin/transferrin/lactoferrin family receptor [Neorhizobium sp. SHOUNA12B]MCJ9746438.1 TonB-dependent hemoglobin/transferrin/lactoferrin family receptor [Neorhizobium sp. SHOUNA12A]